MSEQEGRRNLVLFYSWSGNTRKIARLIAQKTGADWKEIVPKQAYPSNYNTVVEQAKREIQARHYPALRPIDMDWSAYETVYLGTPNWWSTMAPPVASFLHEVIPVDRGILRRCRVKAGSGFTPYYHNFQGVKTALFSFSQNVEFWAVIQLPRAKKETGHIHNRTSRIPLPHWCSFWFVYVTGFTCINQISLFSCHVNIYIYMEFNLDGVVKKRGVK